MKQLIILSAILLLNLSLLAQGAANVTTAKEFSSVYNNAYTPVKSQGQTGTCWSFSTTALLESQLIKNKQGSVDLSEMFTVRNIYVEKAKNYLMRQGAAQFGEGSLGHDVIRAVATYGAMPEQAYSGLDNGQVKHDHSLLTKELKIYLDSLLGVKPIASWWQTAFDNILDKHLGKLPGAFTYDGKIYTASSFAKEFMKFD
ncbi:MAG: aminopeptidase, partial [Gloeobacteraceae cyanobacterium ES-bin-316]|nr:aminopeptidase [Ferruginibacter sp.]